MKDKTKKKVYKHRATFIEKEQKGECRRKKFIKHSNYLPSYLFDICN